MAPEEVQAVFALVTRAMTGIAAQSSIVFMCKIASEHRDKDDLNGC